MKILLLLILLCQNPIVDNEYIIEPEYKTWIVTIREDWDSGKLTTVVKMERMTVYRVLIIKPKLTENELQWFRQFGEFIITIYETTI